MCTTDRRGFTLLEVVVALAVVGTFGVAVLTTLGAELRTADRAHRTLEATALLRDRLTQIELLRADELAAFPDSLATGSFDVPFEEFRWQATVQPVTGEAGLYDVSVSVTWPGGVQHVVTREYRPGAARRP